MALIKDIKPLNLMKSGRHSEVECTFSLVTNEDGRKFLQLDTYGSPGRQIPGKKSQTLRFTPEALQILKQIIQSNGL